MFFIYQLKVNHKLNQFDFYFLDKLDGYKEMQTPGALSGISKIVPLVLILIGLMMGTLPTALKFKLFMLSITVILAAWLLTQHTYARLRFLDLLSFSVPLSILATYSRLKLNFDIPIKIGMLVAGLISAIGVYRGFILNYAVGKSPFMPYEFLN